MMKQKKLQFLKKKYVVKVTKIEMYFSFLSVATTYTVALYNCDSSILYCVETPTKIGVQTL